MPIYDFMCVDCQFENEEWMSVEQSDSVDNKCPQCKIGTYVKIIKKASDFRWGKNCSMGGVYDKSQRLSHSGMRNSTLEEDHDIKRPDLFKGVGK